MSPEHVTEPWIGEESTGPGCRFRVAPGDPACGAQVRVHVVAESAVDGRRTLAACAGHAPIARDAAAILVSEHAPGSPECQCRLPQGPQYLIEYDHRVDGGPRRVGPFDSHDQAEEHAQRHARPGWAASYSVVPITAPGDDVATYAPRYAPSPARPLLRPARVSPGEYGRPPYDEAYEARLTSRPAHLHAPDGLTHALTTSPDGHTAPRCGSTHKNLRLSRNWRVVSCPDCRNTPGNT